MDARIAVGNEIISLSQLKQTGKIQKKGASWPLPLDERSRGKISLADMTILFQFVTPPPPQPRPQLPASVRGSALTGVDWFFTTIAAISFLLPPHLRHLPPQRRLAAQARHRGGARPLRADGGEEAGRAKKVEEKKPTEEKKEEEKKPEKKKGADEEKKAPKHELTDEEKAKLAEEKAKADAERRARLAEQVKSTGLLKLLGAKADGEGSIADVLGKGDVDRDQEKAFQGVGGVGVANNNDQLRGIKSGGTRLGARRRRRRPARRRRHRGRRHRRGRRPRRRSRGVVKSEAPAVDGELDPAMVAKEVRTRLGAIKACYERALKRNPNLSGKVVIHWTITQAGTVSGVDVEQDTLGDAEVASCIKSLVARWRFPAPVRRLGRGLVPVRLPGLTVEVQGGDGDGGNGAPYRATERSGKAISAVDTPQERAYNPWRYYKYLISLKFIGEFRR